MIRAGTRPATATRGRRRREGSGLARKRGRPGRDGPRPEARGADRRDRPDHVERPLRLRPAPLLGARALHDRGRHPRARAAGGRRGGRVGGEPHPRRRPRRDPVQHRLRAVLHVRARAARAVRDDAGTPARQGRGAVRLHEALRRRAGGAGGVPARPAGPFRPGEGAGGPAGRAVRLPLRRAPDSLAGGRVRGRPGRRLGGGSRPRPDRADGRADRASPRPARARRRPRPGAARARRALWRRDADLGRRRGRRRRPPRAHGRARSRRRHRRGRDGGARRPGRRADAEGHDDPPEAGRRCAAGARRGRPAGGPAHRDRRRPARRHALDCRRLRRADRPAADAGPLRQGRHDPHGPGARPALGRRDPAAARRRRPARHRGPGDAHGAARRGAAGLRAVPEEGGRHDQGALPPPSR